MTTRPSAERFVRISLALSVLLFSASAAHALDPKQAPGGYCGRNATAWRSARSMPSLRTAMAISGSELTADWSASMERPSFAGHPPPTRHPSMQR
jgi:purine-cytosine permease-like protein